MPQWSLRSSLLQPIVLGVAHRNAGDIPEMTVFGATNNKFVEEMQATEELTETTMHDYDDTETFPLQNGNDSQQAEEIETTTHEEEDTAMITV